MCFLTTGRGHVIGTPIAPAIKITGNEDTYKTFEQDIDFDAHEILTNKNLSVQLTDRLEKLLKDVCSGKMTKAEKLGHCEYEMLPCFQTPFAAGCHKQAEIE